MESDFLNWIEYLDLNGMEILCDLCDLVAWAHAIFAWRRDIWWVRTIHKKSPGPENHQISCASSGQTLALTEPEARLYNNQTRPPTHPCVRSKCLYWLYLSHFSTKWAVILHDCFLGGKDEVCRQNIDPAALQYSMQRCRIFNRTITQPYFIGLSWNLAWLLLSCK